MVIANFRSQFPEFSDASTYPDAQLNAWAVLGEQMTSEVVFGDVWPYAVMLYVAHQITLAKQNLSSAGSAGLGGIITSKSVGPASVSYDTTSTMHANAGMWNATSYGRQYYALIRQFGMGVIQL